MYDRRENLCNKRLRRRIKENVKLRMIFSQIKRKFTLFRALRMIHLILIRIH